MALATGRSEKVTYVSIGFEPDSNEDTADFQLFGTAIYQAPFASRGNDLAKIQRTFVVGVGERSLLNIFRSWQGLEKEHHPLIETYGSLMLATEEHPRSRFLLLIQAIEGLHGYDTHDAYDVTVEAFENARANFLETLEPLVTDGQLKYLKRNLWKRPASSLDTAVVATLGSLPRDVTSTLKRSPLIANKIKEDPRATTVAGAIRLIRNELAHGNRGYPSHQLDTVANILESVIRAHLLRLLGCPTETQILALDQLRNR